MIWVLGINGGTICFMNFNVKSMLALNNEIKIILPMKGQNYVYQVKDSSGIISLCIDFIITSSFACWFASMDIHDNTF